MKQPFLKNTLTIAALVLLSALFTSSVSFSADKDIQYTGKMLCHIYLDDPGKQIPELARMQLDIAGMIKKEQVLEVIVNDEEYKNLLSLGYKIKIIEKQQKAGFTDYLYHNPAECNQWMQDAETNYPNIAKRIALSPITHEGRTIYGLKISDNVGIEEDEPAVFFNGQHHAREVMTPEVILDLIQYLTSNYASDPQVQNWVNNLEIFLVPTMNVDGVWYVWNSDYYWRKNRRNNGDGSYGVDPNRNYPFKWGTCNGSSGDTSDDTYRGPSPGSEPCVQALMNLANQQHFVLSVSYHSFGEYIIYPFGCDGVYTSEQDLFSYTGDTLAGITQGDSGTYSYDPGTCWQLLYAVDGGDIDWHYAVNGTFPLVFEVNSYGFQPPYSSYRDITCQRHRPAWQYLLSRVYGPSIYGHITDGCTGAPLQAEVQIEEINFVNGENPRHSDSTFGRYHWLTESGTYYITFSKTGYNSQTKEVEVGSGAVEVDTQLIPVGSNALFYYGYSITPGSGDGDGFVDPGESVSMPITLFCAGGNLTGISATLSTSDTYVNISDNYAEWLNINSGDTGECQPNYFHFSVNPACPEGHQIPFVLTLDADQVLCTPNTTFNVEVTEYRYWCPAIGFNLDSNPGWTTGNWSFGVPTAVGGPTSGCTGSFCYGTNLNGNYSSNTTYTLTTQAIDCSEIKQASVKFCRWLENEDEGDTAYVQVSNDNVNWTTVWSGLATDNWWFDQEYNISAVADEKPTVYIRFKLVTDSSINYLGFYVDDVRICGMVSPEGPAVEIFAFEAK